MSTLTSCQQGLLRYKDDKLYPWALPVSHLILFPESANQTIYTQSVTPHDAGNYTCVLKNDTVVHSHTIHLKKFLRILYHVLVDTHLIYDITAWRGAKKTHMSQLDEVPDDPKITYISQDTSVRVGDSLRLFCEAFGGQVDLPDAHSDAYWQKVSANGTVYDVPTNVQQLKSDREDGQTFGVYLMIPSVERNDFGKYVCVISKPGNTIERSVEVKESAVFSPALLDQNWDSDHVLHAIKQLQTLSPKLIVVALKELPKDEAQPKNSQGETLATITRSVPILQWTRRENEKFWYALRLELPAKRSSPNQSSSDKETRLTDGCKECSVDDIV
nr:unnamed protein product [Callosobruchus analis]